MKQVITEDVTNIPQGIVVGLDKRQANTRAHLLEKAEGGDKLPEGFSAYRTRRPIQFKVGEVLFVPTGTQKSIVANLADVDAPGPESDQDPKQPAAKKKAPAKKKGAATQNPDNTED